MFGVERALDGAVDDWVITRLFVGHTGERSGAFRLCLTRASVKTVIGHLPYRSGGIVIPATATAAAQSFSTRAGRRWTMSETPDAVLAKRRFAVLVVRCPGAIA
ncbi:hypothetical protein [Saccharopolyspora hattusasensis]|uniref:hypothetical protein n=1 Tax=Saccharopolyspora hattusasensis TaxID=1128679 RepID=UPI003D973EAA